MTCGSCSLVVAGLAGFLLGAIPFSWILGRWIGGVDIRSVGSGNVGATNVTRALGYGPGVLALLLDAAKGAAAVFLAREIAGADPRGTAAALAGGMAILGHNFTPFLRFRGGKGVATGAGALGVLSPWALLVSLAVFIVTVVASRTVSLGSVLAAVAMPIAVHYFSGQRSIFLMAVLVSGLVVLRHRANLARIFAGKERRLGGGG